MLGLGARRRRRSPPSGRSPHHALTHDNASLAARTAAGHDFGVVLLGVVVAAGGRRLARPRRAWTGRARAAASAGGSAPRCSCCVALVPVAAVAGAGGLLARADRRGLACVAHADQHQPQRRSTTPGRLAELSNSRPLYWQRGAEGRRARPARRHRRRRLRHRPHALHHDTLSRRHAHSYVIETFADFGLIGIALSLALLIAWAIATGADARLAAQAWPAGCERAPTPSASGCSRCSRW